MAEVTGVVEAISTKYDKFGILVNDKWYDTKFPPVPAPNRGDEVTFDDGGKKYINKLRITSAGSSPAKVSTGGSTMKAGGFPVDPLARERSIIRQNALAHATNVVTSFDPKGSTDAELAERILVVARMFERYSAGDLDREEAEALAKASAA